MNIFSTGDGGSQRSLPASPDLPTTPSALGAWPLAHAPAVTGVSS